MVASISKGGPADLSEQEAQMLAVAIPLIALGLALTLSSDLSLREVASKRLWWSGFSVSMAGAAIMVAPLQALPGLLG